MKIALVLAVALFSGCAHQGLQDVLDTLEFKDGEVGCYRVEVGVDAGTGEFDKGQYDITLVRKTSGEPPDC